MFAGLCIFFAAVMGTSVQHVASTSFSILLIASLFVVKDWKKIWQQLAGLEKMLLFSFFLYAMSGVIAFVNVQDVDEYVKELERYLRFLAAIPIYLYFRKYQIDAVRYLYFGVVVSGPFLFYIAFSAYLKNPNIPASGHYHHIIFGGVAMLNIGVMMVILLMKKNTNIANLVIVVSMICGFIAAVLSQSRGVWMVLPLYVVVALFYSLKYSKTRFVSTLFVLGVMAGFLCLSPAAEMINKRVDAAINDVSAFYDKGQYTSSLGTRLAMWEIAIDVWRQNPLVGTGPGDFDDVIRGLQSKGKYVGMDVHGSTHNIYMQSLVNGGLLGFVAMLFAIIVMPLKIVTQSISEYPTRSLAGFVIVGLFAILGLGESWTLRLPTVSVYTLFMIVVISSIFQYKRPLNGIGC